MCEHKRRCALIGCGPMGLGAALELSRQAEGLNLDLILADRDAARVHQVEARLLALQQESGRQMVQSITPIVGNMHSRSIQQVLKDCDCIITALSWADARPLMEFAIANEIDLAGIGRPLADPRQEWGAVSTATLVVGAGLEPGLAEILARRTVEMFDPGVHLRLYCGGIPHSPRPPMRHISWYGSRLTIDPRPTFRITDGQLEEIERFSGAELINAPKIGVLEAYHDAMLPWITEDELFRNRVASMNQKTVRWPGFATKIRTFHELGLLSETPLETPHGSVTPRAMLDAVLQPHIQPHPDDEDVTLLAVQAHGTIDGRKASRSISVVAATDPHHHITGMARLTGGVLAASALHLLTNRPNDRRPQEQGVTQPYEIFTHTQTEQLIHTLRAGGAQIVDSARPWMTPVSSKNDGSHPPV